MKITLGFLFILGVAICSTWASCWWTGCQPRDWAVRGCSHYDQDERENQECRDDRGVEGNKYLCCPKGLGPPPGEEGPTPPPTGEEFVSYEQFRDAVTKNGHPTPSHEQYRNFNSYARSKERFLIR
ncbi:hypothetical protein Ocin01_16331 [Orchesella cincta]|uniref:Secreted protein n=1 Tax=Orchesella cincta TaxID=48709 RepID=A0A1D2MBK3_ORCCI|nr:hypothetical protein Ocin01_16331 [Orchesella cincta]